MLGINLFAEMGVSQQRCHVCCTQTGKPGRWEIKAKGKHSYRNTYPRVEVIRRLLYILQRPLHELERMAVNTGTAWGARQKKTSLSQQKIWSSAVQRRNTQRPCQEKLHFTRHPHVHVCKIGAACIYLCASLRGSAKNTKSTLLYVLF